MDANIRSDLNKRYIILERNQLPIIDVRQSTDAEVLEKLLSDFPYIYVEDSNDHLAGIISKEDYYQKFSSQNHVNRNYCFVYDDKHIVSRAEELREKKFREIPVTDENSKLLFVLRHRKNIIINFDFDWSLCDEDCIRQFFSGYNNILYFTCTNKIYGLIQKTS